MIERNFCAGPGTPSAVASAVTCASCSEFPDVVHMMSKGRALISVCSPQDFLLRSLPGHWPQCCRCTAMWPTCLPWHMAWRRHSSLSVDDDIKPLHEIHWSRDSVYSFGGVVSLFCSLVKASTCYQWAMRKFCEPCLKTTKKWQFSENTFAMKLALQSSFTSAPAFRS